MTACVLCSLVKETADPLDPPMKMSEGQHGGAIGWKADVPPTTSESDNTFTTVNAPVLNFFFCFSFPLLSFRPRFPHGVRGLRFRFARCFRNFLKFHLQIATVSF